METARRSLPRPRVPFLSLRVGSIMRRNVPEVSPKTPLRELGARFRSEGCDSYPVVDRGRVAGVVCKRDFLRHFRFGTRTIVPHYEELLDDPVEAIVNREIIPVTPEMPVTRALALFLTQGTICLPVVDSGGMFLGIVSQDDIIDCLNHLSAGLYSNFERPDSKIA